MKIVDYQKNMNDPKQHWKEFWKNTNKVKSNRPLSYQRLALKVLAGKLAINQGVMVLNAGAGIDIVSLNLKKRFPKTNFYLLDISEDCLQMNETIFQKHNQKVSFIQGDIFEAPFKDNKFDIIFNTGVMEHFSKSEQVEIFDEMLRLLKPGGIYLTFNPSKKGRLYNYVLKVAQKKNKWPFGNETPVDSFAWYKNKDVASIEEFNMDGLSQFMFLVHIFPKLRIPISAIDFLINMPLVNILTDKIMCKTSGTYLLLTEIRKKTRREQ